MKETISWKPLHHARDFADTRALAFNVLNKYRDKDFIVSVADQCTAASVLEFPPQWSNLSLPGGNVGVALALGYAARLEPDEGWDVLAHQYLETAINGGLRASGNVSLHGGIAGLGHAIFYLSREGKRYHNALEGISKILKKGVHKALSMLPDTEEGVKPEDYDLISGVSGIGRTLLSIHRAFDFEEELVAILDWLVKRSLNGLNGFYTPSQLVSEYDRENSPHLQNGYINFGLAHGVPGPIVLMAKALESNLNVSDLRESLSILANELAEASYEDSYGINWTTRHVEGEEAARETRTAWCYGLPGVARSLYMAGSVLNEVKLTDKALESLLSIDRRPYAVRAIPGPTFCHGASGLLQVVLRMRHDTQSPELDILADSLLSQLLQLYIPNDALGFRHFEKGNHYVTSPSLLTGAIGPALVMLASVSNEAPDWDQIFLLS